MNEHISSDRLISHHRSREDYEQSPVNSLQFGYGDHRYVKFTYELLNESDILKQKILLELVDDFSLCDNINLALVSSDLLSVLIKHLTNTNQVIRALAIKVITKVTSSPLGQKHIIKKQCIQSIEQLINDYNPQIRRDCYDSLIKFAQFTDGINCLLDNKSILPHLVDKLIEEKQQSILLRTVKLLKILMQGEAGIPHALQTSIISRLMSIIDHKYEKIRYNVCMTLANISFNQAGKQQIVIKGHIKSIAPFIDDKDSYVREACTLLLCSLTQLNRGKDEVLLYCSFDRLIQLLDDQPATVLNVVQLIGNLAEEPKGKQKAIKFLKKIDSINNIERSYVNATIDIIKWVP